MEVVNINRKYMENNYVYKRNVSYYNEKYIAFQKNGPSGAVLHSVGCSQPTADVFYKSWNREDFTSACVHAFIDADSGDVLQTLPWNFRGAHGASGVNGSVNDTHVGIEMCESDCIIYTSGTTFTVLNAVKAQQHAERAYRSAVSLFAYLCRVYGWDPLKPGTIMSHKEAYGRGLASNHGDPEHYWKGLGLKYTMEMFRHDVNAAMDKREAVDRTEIMGKSVVTSAQMIEYLKKVNPSVAQSIIYMIPMYIIEGAAEGVRGDIAFAQSCLETGNFTFSGGTAVTIDQNNFCGMGVTQKGLKGNSFDSPELGIRAQIQHLKAYATYDPLNNYCIDPRFKYVQRGSAPYVEYLGISDNPEHVGWAAGAGYGTKILDILAEITNVPSQEQKVNYPVYKIGEEYKLNVELNVRSGPGVSYARKSWNQLTADGKKHDVDRDGALDRGTKITCIDVAITGNDIWIKCPSGWLAAYYSGLIYISKK